MILTDETIRGLAVQYLLRDRRMSFHEWVERYLETKDND